MLLGLVIKAHGITYFDVLVYVVLSEMDWDWDESKPMKQKTRIKGDTSIHVFIALIHVLMYVIRQGLHVLTCKHRLCWWLLQFCSLMCRDFVRTWYKHERKRVVTPAMYGKCERPDVAIILRSVSVGSSRGGAPQVPALWNECSNKSSRC